MKRILLFFVAMTAFATMAGAQGWFRQPTPNDTLRSVVVLPDNSVVFQIYAPQAESVVVTGDLPWDRPARFVKEENGVWKGRISTMTEGVYRYRFMVDGVSVYDRKAPYAGETSALLTVAQTGDEFFAMKNTGPACIIHGTGDQVVPYTYGERYHYIWPGSELYILPAADHGFSKNLQEAVYLMVDFLVRNL